MESKTKKIRIDTVDKENVNGRSRHENFTMEVLNNDCLLQIFEYLPISDRIRLERVNKRWRSVSKASWSSFKKLNFARNTWGYFNQMQVTTKILNKVLDHCFKFVTHLDMSNCNILVDRIYIGHIFERCYNLTSVNFNAFKLNSQLLGLLIMYCKNIKEFIIGNTSCSISDYLIEQTVLLTYKNLKVLKFKNHKLNGLCLRSITRNIEELHLDYCYRLNLTYVRFVIPSLKNLRTLSLRGSLNYCFDYSFLKQLNWSNIKKLDISNNSKYINDECLREISDSCKNLQSLDLSRNYKVSDSGLAAVTWSSLEHLSVDFLWHITGTSLLDMPSLKTLSCRDCYKLDGNFLEPMLQTSGKLELLDLSNCPKVSKNLIETAKSNVLTQVRIILSS